MKISESKRKQYRDYTRRKRQEIIDLLGGVCVECGFSDLRALQIDHINGGGHQERVKRGNGHTYYNHILREIDAGKELYQLLCANCNWIKRYEEHEYLHVGNTLSNTRG